VIQTPSISVVGGVYEERCLTPAWHELFGSAGRACSAIAAMAPDVEVTLVCNADNNAMETLRARCSLEGSRLAGVPIGRTGSFNYVHGLARPEAHGVEKVQSPLHCRDGNILRFGMAEGDAIVDGQNVVYDPQSPMGPTPFHANGSKATHLAVVLNEREANALTGSINSSAVDLAHAVMALNHAEVVVLKRGPLGALVASSSGVQEVSAYQTTSVWALGSGDIFSAHFALNWALGQRSAEESAVLASQATAFYCQTQGFPTPRNLRASSHLPVVASHRFQIGHRPTVYLAGPFFTLAQLWLVDQARSNLQHFGLRVFSPYHDVGYGAAMDVAYQDLDALGKADLVFAIADGLDAGTIYEIGYARARDIPVVVYCENETPENLKMMEGSGCIVIQDYVGAIYQAIWKAMAL
jgi:hypothetical protein